MSDASMAGGINGSGSAGFLSTRNGKLVATVGGVVALVVVVGLVGSLVLGSMGGGGQAEAAPPAGSIVPRASAADPVSLPPVPEKRNSEVFSPRDPFEAIMVPVTVPITPALGAPFGSTGTTGTTGSGAPAGTVDTDPDTLVLIDIVEENGVRTGEFTLGGTSYKVAAGERLGDTPWQVASMTDTSATMMFGDSQVVLTIGAGLKTQ